jgi:cysteine-rich repeat protein
MRSAWLFSIGLLVLGGCSAGDGSTVDNDDGQGPSTGSGDGGDASGPAGPSGPGGSPNGPASGTGGTGGAGGATSTGTAGATSTGTGGGPSTMPNCGDGNVDLGEECDGADLGGKTCESLGLGTGTLKCTMACKYDASGCAMQGKCGDTIVGPGEECDDGNAFPGDGCDQSCQFEGHPCGVRETPGTADEAVEACVCALDSYCCQTAWDTICVSEAMKDCGVKCGDPCAAHANPGSDDAQVTACVCQLDPNCCKNAWSAGCVALAKTDCSACAPPAVCGNGKIEPPEQCDDGNTKNGDGCSSMCLKENAVCGNGKLEGNEECDDGNTTAGDGCDAGCQFEGHACVPRQTPGVADETVEACVCALDSFCCQTAWDSICVNEAIKDCQVNCGDPCTAHNNPGSNDPQITQCVCALDSFCCNNKWDSLCVSKAKQSCGACPTPVCGNGKLEAGEQCDDGNTKNGDGCSASCMIETSVCGNSKIEAGEECDDGNTTAGDGCSASCQYEGHACVPRKTPGVDNEAVEACVCGLDPFCCNVAWDALCVQEAMGQCGVSCGDPCTAHANPGSSKPAVTDCVCAIDSYCCKTSWDTLCASEAANNCGACAICGNGITETGEECDDGNTTGGDGCSATCQFDGHACVPRKTPGVKEETTEACVCVTQNDPYCCNTAWDALCVNKAVQKCGVQCGDPCVVHSNVGSNDGFVTDCVCNGQFKDVFCCQTSWDSICVSEANSCGAMCF